MSNPIVFDASLSPEKLEEYAEELVSRLNLEAVVGEGCTGGKGCVADLLLKRMEEERLQCLRSTRTHNLTLEKKPHRYSFEPHRYPFNPIPGKATVICDDDWGVKTCAQKVCQSVGGFTEQECETAVPGGAKVARSKWRTCKKVAEDVANNGSCITAPGDFHAFSSGLPDFVGCKSNMGMLLRLLAALDNAQGNGDRRLFVDVGANKGFELLEMLELWGAPMQRLASSHLRGIIQSEYAKAETQGQGLRPNEWGDVESLTQWWSEPACSAEDHKSAPVMVAFEPSPKTFQVLTSVVQSLVFDRGLACPQSVVLRNEVVSDEDLPGGTDFFEVEGAPGLESNSVYLNAAEHGHVGENASFFFSGQGRARKLSVPAVRLDSVFGSPAAEAAAAEADGNEQWCGADIFLLKVDCEGHDRKVLLGARGLLQARQVEFVVFEYHYVGDWKAHSLRETVQMLDGFGYDVYRVGTKVQKTPEEVLKEAERRWKQLQRRLGVPPPPGEPTTLSDEFDRVEMEEVLRLLQKTVELGSSRAQDLIKDVLSSTGVDGSDLNAPGAPRPDVKDGKLLAYLRLVKISGACWVGDCYDFQAWSNVLAVRRGSSLGASLVAAAAAIAEAQF